MFPSELQSSPKTLERFQNEKYHRDGALGSSLYTFQKSILKHQEPLPSAYTELKVNQVPKRFEKHLLQDYGGYGSPLFWKSSPTITLSYTEPEENDQKSTTAASSRLRATERP